MCPCAASAAVGSARTAIAHGDLLKGLAALLSLISSTPSLATLLEGDVEGCLRDLSEELTHTENKVAFSRQLFNDATLDYNNAAHQFPTNIVAGLFGFRTASMLQATASEAERNPVKVSF